jgi:hypothetical protein
LITYKKPTDADVDFVCDPLENPIFPAQIKCTDRSNEDVKIEYWKWQFLDKDGVEVWSSWGSSEQTSTARIGTQGVYDVVLTIGNNGGEASLRKEKYVIVGEGTFAIIYPGWNHVSVPVALADGYNTMADIFIGIPTGAWPYSVYNWNIQDWGEVNDNYIVKPLELVRINSVAEPSAEATFVFAAMEGAYENSLREGWNGIGISAWQPVKASEALESLGDKWDRVIGYDAKEQKWENPIYRTVNADDLMHPGMGYLILMDEDAVFKNSVKL